MKILLSTLLIGITYSQPSTLMLIEEQIEAVLMVHCVEYEIDQKAGGHLTDVNVVYTGNNTIDAVMDSGFYFVYGSYTYERFTQVNNQMFGTLNGQSTNKAGSTSYLAKVKPVLDEYRVQEIVIVKEPSEFDFAKFNYKSLKEKNDMIFPEVIRRSVSKSKKDKKKKKD